MQHAERNRRRSVMSHWVTYPICLDWLHQREQSEEKCHNHFRETERSLCQLHGWYDICNAYTADVPCRGKYWCPNGKRKKETKISECVKLSLSHVKEKRVRHPTQTPPSLSPSLLPSLPLSCSSRSSAFYAYSIPTMPTYGWQARRDAHKKIFCNKPISNDSVCSTSTRRKGLHERLSVFL